jgi:hypothetical protein
LVCLPVSQALHFHAFFNEAVTESRLEAARTRVLVIKYFVDDGTVEMYEPEVRNSGMPAGKFLKRVLHPGVTPETLHIGGTIEVYGRVLKLFECDEFARVRGPRRSRVRVLLVRALDASRSRGSPELVREPRGGAGAQRGVAGGRLPRDHCAWRCGRWHAPLACSRVRQISAHALFVRTLTLGRACARRRPRPWTWPAVRMDARRRP